MKIFHIINSLNIGGAEMGLVRLVEASQGRGLSHTVATLLDGAGRLGARVTAAGAELVVCDLGRPGRIASDIARLARAVHRARPDVLHGWMYQSNLAAAALWALGLRRSRLLWSIHNSLSDVDGTLSQWHRTVRLTAAMSAWPDAIVYCARTGAQNHEALGYQAAKSRVLPYAFDCTFYRPRGPLRSRLKANLGIPESRVIFGQVARVHPMKDHDNFFAALALLIQRGHDVHALLIGRDATPENPSIRAMWEARGLAGRVSALGERRDIPELMPALDVLVSPSAYGEGLPNVIGEALACGIPCVATDVGDSAWLVGDAGRVVPPRRPDELADALEDLIRLGPAGREALGASGRTRVSSTLSLGAVAARYADLYASVVEASARKPHPNPTTSC